ncbi:MAG: hypothetical protein ACFE7R_07950 [Candidatus Hodarchaeota archaeon]
MMDHLLKKAKALYQDRQRIAFSTLLVVFAITFYLFYSPGIYTLAEPPRWFPSGWTAGLEVVASYNTIGFFLAFALMVFAYGFWSWAFLPTPASLYTVSVLQGILGSRAEIRQIIGKRFRAILASGAHIDIVCRVKEQSNGEWFVYRLASSPVEKSDAENIALRHGMSLRNHRFTTSVGNTELHSRTLLLAKALTLAEAA